jgi:hypothetical protein
LISFLDSRRFWHIIAIIDTRKDCETDEYALYRLYREQDQVRACQYDDAEWTVELQSERASARVGDAGVATVIQAKGIG